MHRLVRVAAGIALLSAVFGLLATITLDVRAAKRWHKTQPAAFDADWVQVNQILLAKCFACHLHGDPAIDFSNYETLMAAHDTHGDPLVVPGRPDQSPLFLETQWEPPACGQNSGASIEEPHMPMGEMEYLTAGQLAVIQRWIARGAPQFSQAGGARLLSELDFPSAKQCKGCHPHQYEGWSRSMHAYAQKSPVFEAFNRVLSERNSGTQGTFCTRCHTPVGTALGEPGLLRNEHRSKLSMEGITCVACHRRSHEHGRVNSQFSMQPGDMLTSCMYGPFDDPVYSDDKRHPSAGLPYIRTSMFCGSCHDVTTPAGLRVEEAFSEWRNSPAAKAGITCHHCHMGPVPGVPIDPQDRPLGYAAVVPGLDASKLKKRPLTDHTFAGPDYSLIPITQFPETLDWMDEIDPSNESQLSDYHRRTLSELVDRNAQSLAKADLLRRQLLKNAAKIEVDAPSQIRAGGLVKFKVAVTSLFSGHNFPTGFSEERQAWVEVLVHDEQGNLVFASGDLDHNGDLRDEHSHEVITGRLKADHQLMNFQSKFVVRTERGAERPVILPVNRDVMQVNILRPAFGPATAFGSPPVVRILKTSLPPLATRRKTYVFRAPSGPQTCHYRVRLLFRNLPPALLDRIGVGHLKPLLRIVVIDEKSGLFDVSASSLLHLRKRSE